MVIFKEVTYIRHTDTLQPNKYEHENNKNIFLIYVLRAIPQEEFVVQKNIKSFFSKHQKTFLVKQKTIQLTSQPPHGYYIISPLLSHVFFNISKLHISETSLSLDLKNITYYHASVIVYYLYLFTLHFTLYFLSPTKPKQ